MGCGVSRFSRRRPALATSAKTEPKDYVRLGLSGLKLLLESAGPLIPFPGASGVLQGLAALLGMIETSMDNDANVTALRDRCFDILQVVVENRAGFEALAGQENEGAVGKLLNKFADVLGNIKAYAEEYGGRRGWKRVLTSGGDAKDFSALQAQLKDVIDDVTLILTADVRSQTSLILARLDSALGHVDTGAAARAFVQTHGGIESVMKDTALTNEMVKLFTQGEQLVTLLMQQALEELRDYDGRHKNIKNDDMSLFWRKRFTGSVAEIKWPEFWRSFPDELAKNPIEPAEQVREIQAALSDKEARPRFEISLGGADVVTVLNIADAFPAGRSLLDSVRLAAGSNKTWLFQLPWLSSPFVGRDDAVVDLVARLAAGGAVITILGEGGVGKSTLALRVGGQLWKQRHIPGGALFVDLREAWGAEDVYSRFWAALSIDAKHDIESADCIVVELRRRTVAGDGSLRPLLLYVDNAEDPLNAGGASSAAFVEVLAKIMSKAENRVRLLLTSRQRLPEHDDVPAYHFDLSGLDPASAAQLVTTIAPDLRAGEAEEVARLCRYMSLIMTLVATALKNGRLAVKDLRRLARDNDVNWCVDVMVASLPRQQQLTLATLCVFPSAFNEYVAAAVLDVQVFEAAGDIAVLERHGLVTRDTARHSWTIHDSVKPLAAAMLPKAEAATAKAALIRGTLRKLGHLNEMYSASPMLALQLAREREADLSCIFAWLARHPGPLAPAVVSDAATWIPRSAHLCIEGLALWRNADYIAAQRRIVDAASAAAPEDPATVAAISCLAHSLVASGAPAAAEPLLRQALAIHERLHGHEQPDTITSMNSLAICLVGQGRGAEAEPMYRSALESRSRMLGSAHADTITSINNLAKCLAVQGKHADSERMLRHVITAQTKAVGTEHPETVHSASHLATCLSAQGKDREAEPLLRAAVERHTRLLGLEHPYTIRALGRLAACLRAQGRHARAEPVLREALELQMVMHRRESMSTGTILASLESCLDAQGKSANDPGPRGVKFA